MKDVKKDVKKLQTSRFLLADHHVRRFVAQVPEGTTLKQAMHPEYFGNVMPQLVSQRTSVRVMSDDGSLRADIFLVGKTQTTCKWEVDQIYKQPGDDVETTDMDEATPYELNWGGAHKWRILHNGEVIEKEIDSKEIAQARLEFLRKL